MILSGSHVHIAFFIELNVRYLTERSRHRGEDAYISRLELEPGFKIVRNQKENDYFSIFTNSHSRA
jgi:hypothetical protein